MCQRFITFVIYISRKFMIQLFVQSIMWRMEKMKIFSFVLFMLNLQHNLSLSSPTQEFHSLQIVDGYEIDIKKVPYHVMLHVKIDGKDSWEFLCGGSVISNRAVLTAAHCASFVPDPSSVRIIVGSSNRLVGGVAYDVSSVYSHEDFNSETLVNDVAMMFTVKVFVFGEYTAKIPVAPKNFDLPAGSEALVAGFGQTNNEPLSETLLAANVTIVSQESCEQAYHNFEVKVQSGMVCANVANTVKGPCHGDSGGGLVSKGHVVGIVSWSNGCAEPAYPTVYTRVSEYESWINEHMAQF